MEGNLNDFLNSWKDICYDNVPVLSTKALKEIENLRCHIKKGCLSSLPPGGGSERNENMHKYIKQAVSRGRMGVLLAVSLISSFLYTWNEKRQDSKHFKKTNTVRPLISRKSELINDARPITNETFGIGVSKGEPVLLDSVQLPYKECEADGFLALLENESLVDSQDDESEDDESDSTFITKFFKDSSEFTDLLTQANNLFILREGIQSFGNRLTVNTSHIHLMNLNALFSFGSLTSDNLEVTEANNRLNNVIKGYGFEKIDVSPDGDCLFASILFQIQQVISSDKEYLSYLLSLGLGPFDTQAKDSKIQITLLRELMVKEWLANRQEYEGYITGNETEYVDIVIKYKQSGVYDGEFGNLMVLSLSNALKVNIVLLSSMENFPVVPFLPGCKFIQISCS
jgi:hypothetical protein